jgi:hypothetical protein
MKKKINFFFSILKGASIVRGLLGMQKTYPRLRDIPVYAGVHHEISSTALEGASIVVVDSVNNPDSTEHAMKQASKLLLLVDPLSGEIKQEDVLAFAEG